ncbi:MAG: twin-arginine translocase TatA/TatE family subunit [Planctomycetota bacterium]
MFGTLGWQELLIVLAILALLFGATRVADLGGALGKPQSKFRRTRDQPRRRRRARSTRRRRRKRQEEDGHSAFPSFSLSLAFLFSVFSASPWFFFLISLEIFIEPGFPAPGRPLRPTDPIQEAPTQGRFQA